MRTMKQLHFEEKDFRKLRNLKEEGIILGKWKNWEEFILSVAKIN